MSHYNGWSDVPLTPEETWEQRAEAFRRGMSEVDEAGDMLAELRYQIADLLAERGVAQLVIAELTRERDDARGRYQEAAALSHQYRNERDEARAALMKRITRDAA